MDRVPTVIKKLFDEEWRPTLERMERRHGKAAVQELFRAAKRAKGATRVVFYAGFSEGFLAGWETALKFAKPSKPNPGTRVALPEQQ